jgi:hypothetical protein
MSGAHGAARRYGSGAGGIAYVGSFSWDSDTPAYAFMEELQKYPRYVWEAVIGQDGPWERRNPGC